MSGLLQQVGASDLAPFFIGHTNDRCLKHMRVFGEMSFDFGSIYILTT